MQELVDVAAVTDLAHAAARRSSSTTFFGTPVFSKPLDLGADIRRLLGDKHIDGQGRTLGGAVLGPKEFIDGRCRNLMRHTARRCRPSTRGSSSGARDDVAARRADGRQRPRGRAIPRGAPRVRRVVHPFLESHPQHDLAKRQMLAGGTVVTSRSTGQGRGVRPHERPEVVDISNNLGDSKSLITHRRRRRTAADARGGGRHPRWASPTGVLRVSVGLEDVRDLVDDLGRALG